ncbi:hypothetical protein ACJZ2D_013305 [Fusarium nematophilum]
MATPQVRGDYHQATPRAQEKSHDTTTPTFIGYLLENVIQFSDAFEMCFENDPLTCHPLSRTLISQLRFFIDQFRKMVEAQDRLLQELEATQIALAQKDEALAHMVDLYERSQVAMNRITGSGLYFGAIGERKVLPQQQGYSSNEVPEWI